MMVMKNQTRGVACIVVFVLFLHITLTSLIDSSGQSPEPAGSWTPKNKRALSQNRTITCDRSHKLYDLCSINGPTLLDPTTATLFSTAPTNLNPPSLPVKAKPHPQKEDNEAMSRVKELTLSSAPPEVSCGVTHTSPAIVFSAGGYIGNLFHDFMDGLLPLYITINSVLPDDNQDVILVVTDYKDWWIRKYAELLSHFSHHPIINLDNETITHCFPSVTVGLITHGYAILDPKLLPQPKTLLDFKAFLDTAYGQNDVTTAMSYLQLQPSKRPRLLLMNRTGNIGRVILNLEEVKKTAEEVGFDVTVFEPTRNTSLVELFRVIRASHAMLGVHGAALTHFLFLRPGSVLMQVVPIGLQRNADMCFADPSRILGFQYLDYKIQYKESTLAEKYAPNDLVVTDPVKFTAGIWKNLLVYLNQDVKIDTVKFKLYLKEAYKKANRFMEKEG